MWKLVMLGERGSPFTELGSYANLGDAARVVLKTENDPIKYLLKRAQTNRKLLSDSLSSITTPENQKARSIPKGTDTTAFWETP